MTKLRLFLRYSLGLRHFLSRSAALDLGLIEYDAACHRIYQEAFGIAGGTMAI